MGPHGFTRVPIAWVPFCSRRLAPFFVERAAQALDDFDRAVAGGGEENRVEVGEFDPFLELCCCLIRSFPNE